MARAKKTDRAEARRRTRASAVAAQSADRRSTAVDPARTSRRPTVPRRPRPQSTERDECLPRGLQADPPPGRHPGDPVADHPDAGGRRPGRPHRRRVDVVPALGGVGHRDRLVALRRPSPASPSACSSRRRRSGRRSWPASSPRGCPTWPGFITGLASFIAFSIVVSVAPPGTVDPLPAGIRESWVLWALSIGPVSGILIGAFAGFYRRFLRQINPNSGAKPQPSRERRSQAPAGRAAPRPARPALEPASPSGASRPSRADGRRAAEPDRRPRRSPRGAAGSLGR